MNSSFVALALTLTTGAVLSLGHLPLPLVAPAIAAMSEAAPLPQTAAPKAYSVDTVHSTVLFRVKHLNASWAFGRFNDVTGTFLFDAETPANSSLDITIKAESVDTASENRDKHLRSPDFFSSKEFPVITFKSTAVRKTATDSYEVVGDLTFRGVTKAITTSIEQTGAGPGMRGGEIAGMLTTFTIKRSDFGIDYMPQALGDDVTVTVSLEGGR